MKTNPSRIQNPQCAKNAFSGRHPCALLWDESFLWGLAARSALIEAGLPFDLIQSADIRQGALSDYAMIFVPGGWAQAKMSALGEMGQMELRRFVERGGGYLGICGGAGLATDQHLGLLPIQRIPQVDRVPSFSGPIRLTLVDHPLWKDLETSEFYAWWPPQFDAGNPWNIRILARFGDAHPDAQSADIRVADGHRAGWPSLEKEYGIFLDPERLKKKPAVFEGGFGKGTVILSLVHFDTPGDLAGRQVLQNLWPYLTGCITPLLHKSFPPMSFGNRRGHNDPLTDIMDDIQIAVDRLIALGEQLLLWRRRNAWLLQWRRGIRGMEYSTLAAMTETMADCLSGRPVDEDSPKNGDSFVDTGQVRDELESIRDRLIPFAHQAEMLLRLEHVLWTEGSASPRKTFTDEDITRLRQDLFGSTRHFGGRFKPLIAAVDRLLYSLLKHYPPRVTPDCPPPRGNQ
jgi:putative intracellular protease/amidase